MLVPIMFDATNAVALDKPGYRCSVGIEGAAAPGVDGFAAHTAVPGESA
jgi:hypothetical protein